MGQPRILVLTDLLFWLVFLSKFPEQAENVSIIELFRKRLSEVYTRLFHSLPKPKEEFANHLIFILTYVVHKSFYDIFSEERDIFNLRFVLDCYHLSIFELNGTHVTDFYLQMFIDKIFTYKFLDYNSDAKNRKIKNFLASNEK